MADSFNTPIASSIPQSFRRLFLAAGSAGAVFGSLARAIAQTEGGNAVAGSAPMSEALAQAIERHKAALAAVNMCGDSDAEIDAACEIERQALSEIVLTPCASDSELMSKLRYLIAYECRNGWPIIAEQLFEDFGSIVVAVDAHLNPEA